MLIEAITTNKGVLLIIAVKNIHDKTYKFFILLPDFIQETIFACDSMRFVVIN